LKILAWPRRLAYPDPMTEISALLTDPAAWAALVTLVIMEVVLGIDNLIFISILSNKLPPEHRQRTRRIGIGLALIMRLGLLAAIGWIIGLTATVVDLGLSGDGWDTAFSWRDLILIAGGLFLVWKATTEVHHAVDTSVSDDLLEKNKTGAVINNVGSAIVQIIMLDLVFSIDSILTAVGMTDHVPIMMVAVIIAVAAMLFASDPLAEFIDKNPTVVMLALGFLLMIGMVLIADGFGVHVPKGYIYAAMAFSALVEGLNMMGRKASEKKQAALAARQAELNKAETAEPGV
jgi:predicted tellurium resistance membrane protein TerC